MNGKEFSTCWILVVHAANWNELAGARGAQFSTPQRVEPSGALPWICNIRAKRGLLHPPSSLAADGRPVVKPLSRVGDNNFAVFGMISVRTSQESVLVLGASRENMLCYAL